MESCSLKDLLAEALTLSKECVRIYNLIIDNAREIENTTPKNYTLLKLSSRVTELEKYVIEPLHNCKDIDHLSELLSILYVLTYCGCKEDSKALFQHLKHQVTELKNKVEKLCLHSTTPTLL